MNQREDRATELDHPEGEFDPLVDGRGRLGYARDCSHVVAGQADRAWAAASHSSRRTKLIGHEVTLVGDHPVSPTTPFLTCVIGFYGRFLLAGAPELIWPDPRTERLRVSS